MGEVAHEIYVLKLERLVKPVVPFRGSPNVRVSSGSLAKDGLNRVARHCLN
jgi:hypothetical protein